jgi:hypothetical protein
LHRDGVIVFLGQLPQQRDTMSDYRAYIVGIDGHFKSSKIIVAQDDEEAVEMAEKYCEEHAVEVWQLDRKIAVLPLKV